MEDQSNPITLSVKYEPLFEWLSCSADNPLHKVDTVVITGGRNSQKSFAVGTFTCVAAKDFNHRVLYSRYTLTSAQDSIIPEFNEKITLLNAYNSFTVTKDRIEGTENDSKIVFKGIKTSSGNQTAALKSLKGFSMFVLEEAEEMPNFDDWDKIRKSIRAKDVRNINILILNPTTKTHWIYEELYESNGVNEGFNGIVGNVMFIHSTYEDMDRDLIADNIWEDFEDKRRAYELWINLPKDRQDVDYKLKKKALYYKHTVKGGWLEKSEGVIFENWVIGEYIDTGYTLFGSDFGFSQDPTTLVRVSVDRKHKKIYLQQECYRAKLTTDEIANIMIPVCGNQKIIADSAEPRLITELKGKGLNIKGAIKGQGSIKEGIAVLLNYDLVVTPDSLDLIRELNNYAWSDKKSEVPIDAHNHIIDAIRYACSELLTPVKKVSFGWD